MWSENHQSNAVDKTSGSIQATEMHAHNPAANPQQPATRKAGRDRSMSVPCHPTTSSGGASSDVETVVTKAKRASSYLWMLLHSQNCRLGVDRCTHAGCADAKLVHLHLKTCSAGQDVPCPSQTNGCLQARKLLAHYRRCRSIRARQVGQAPGAKGPHVCLICSMVARQARSLLDSNAPRASSQGVVAHKKSSGSSKCQVFSAFSFKAKVKPATLSSKSDAISVQRSARILASFTLSKDSRVAASVDDWDMPPPAPRNPLVSQSAPGSPSDGQDPKRKTCSVSPIQQIRKRSESLGSELILSRGQRAVSFAPRPEFLDQQREESLVAVELVELASTTEPVREDMGSPLRVRSASCHVLSSSSPPAKTSCGTIYEEIGPPPSCMEE